MKTWGLLLRVLGTIVFTMALMLGTASPILAAEPEPDSVSLDGIVIFQDLLVEDDFLAFVPYDIPFIIDPSVTIDQTFIFRLLSPDGTSENGTTLATPAYNGGYGSGVVSFYFASGMTSEEAYVFRVQQNPTYYPSSQYWDFVIGASDYSTEADQATALKAKVVDSATFLTAVFGTALLTSSEAGTTVLSTYGELYYLTVLPGLQNMCPALFSVQLEDPDYTKRSWSFTLADALKTKYDDTFVYDFMTGYAGLFSMETTASMNFLCIMLFAVTIGISVWKFKATMLSAFGDGYAVLLLLMLMGFADMVLVGALAFCSAVIGGVILFLNKA